MSELWAELLGRHALFRLGLSLSLLGVVLWVLPRRFRRTFEMRRDQADQLRAAGEDERARKVAIQTARLIKWLPIYGRLLVMTGALILLFSGLRRG